MMNMKSILTFLAKGAAIFGFAVLLGLAAGWYITKPIYAGFNPTGGSTYYLQSSLSQTQSTITLTSFQEPVSNIPYTMAYLNTDIVYATINPETTRSEFVSFTGITQNSNGTATLTGVVRGLERSYPFVASSTLAGNYPGQTKFILSSPPQFFNEYAVKRNSQWITGTWGFGALPVSSTTCSTAYQFCNKSYIDGGLNQGAATSTFANMGLVQLATSVQVASSTGSSSTQKPLVLSSKFGTTTPGILCTTGIWNCIPVASVLGKISQLWIDFSTNNTWTGSNTFSATTSIAASNVNSNALKLNGVAYAFPAANATGTLLNDGQGNLTWGGAPRYTLVSNSDFGSAGAYATSSVLTVPASFITASSTIHVHINYQCQDATSADGQCNYYIRTSTGTTFATLASVPPSSGGIGNNQGFIDAYITPNNSVSAQITIAGGAGVYSQTAGFLGDIFGGTSDYSSSVNMANSFGLVIVAQGTNAHYTPVVSNYYMEVNK